MSYIPTPRQHLSGDALIAGLRQRFETIPDPRDGEVQIALADALMSAYAMFFLKDPSMLAFDQRRHDPNLQSVFGIAHVPSDTQMRTILDEVDPATLYPCFRDIFRAVQRGKLLEGFVFFEGAYLLSMDGPGYFSSSTIHCRSCLQKHHANGSVTYYHQMVAGALVHPDRKEVIPLAPEPMIQQEGATKNDCERNASKRFLQRFRRDHPHLPVIGVEDGLSANGPHILELQRHRCHFILGVKGGDHAGLFQRVAAAVGAGNALVVETSDPRTGTRHRFLAVRPLPLNETYPDLFVNFLEYWEIAPTGEEVQHFSWVTDLPLTPRTVGPLMRGGRARWKIENETFNTLKKQGYHYEHNYGHGEEHLSVVLALLMMLAFVIDQVPQLACPLFQAAWKVCGSKRQLWERLRSLFYDFHVASVQALWTFLITFTKQSPVPVLDTS